MRIIKNKPLLLRKNELKTFIENIFIRDGNYIRRSIITGIALFFTVSSAVIAIELIKSDPISIIELDKSIKIEIRDIILSSILAPAIETCLMAIIFSVSRKISSMPEQVFVVAVVVMAILGHRHGAYTMFSVTIAFTLFSVQYMVIYNRIGLAGALLGVFLSHSVNNLIALIIMMLCQ